MKTGCPPPLLALTDDVEVPLEEGPELVVGIAVVTWRFVMDRASSDQFEDLMRCLVSYASKTRIGVRFIEHPFLDAACVVGELDPLHGPVCPLSRRPGCCP